MKLLEPGAGLQKGLNLGLATAFLVLNVGLSGPPLGVASQTGLAPDDETYVYLPLITRNAGRAFFQPPGIVFHSDYQGNDEIYRMEDDGTGLVRLTTTTNAWRDQSPAWGPGKTQVVFQSNREGQNEIYVMNADGSDVQRLTDNNCDDLTPVWSLITNKIAWASNCHGPDYDIWIMDSDGHNQVDISSNGRTDSAPRWSPIGNQIAYVVNNNTIEIMNGDGSNSQVLTPGLFTPDWSPDGLQIAYTCLAGANREVCVIDVVGGQPLQLTHLASHEENPGWSPNGQSLVLASNFSEGGARYNLYTMDVSVDAPLLRVPDVAVIPEGSDEGGPDW